MTLSPASPLKVDLLLAIDNSSSMADKQDLLAAAIPTFVHRLLVPRCVDLTTHVAVPGDGAGCSTVRNSALEYPAVSDLHIGIVSSSLGGGGSLDVCVENASDTTHQNDHAHLLNRTLGTPEGTVKNARPTDGNGGNFLAWLPLSDKNNAGKEAADVNVTIYGDAPFEPETQFAADLQSLVAGVQERGCGLEGQLESWYRFLIQPDPWDHIELNTNVPPRATLVDVDATLLKMRKDFLRPDSIVVILQLTDEEDSWSDPMWLNGYGWTNRTMNFPGGPGGGAGPRGTTECDQSGNADCSSCAFPGSAKPISKQLIGSDPNCNACAGAATGCPQVGWYTPASPTTPIAAADGINVRYAQQTTRARYGFDSQFPIQRYIDGLTLPTVPDRDHESTAQRNCTNPLFVEDLPDGSDTTQGALCNGKFGTRIPRMVFYDLIGGVPNALAATPVDWTKVVGQDPEHGLLDGIDPHMRQSIAPRAGLEAPGSTYSLGSDAVSGREWNTLTSIVGIDLQYACTFALPTPRDCTAPENASACDCSGAATLSADGPPLCDPQNRTMQTRGKAYPTIRELRVAQGLAEQGAIASICPTDASGYAPAMDAFIDKLGAAFGGGGQCADASLPHDAHGNPLCTLLVMTSDASCSGPGLSVPPPDVLQAFDRMYAAELGDASSCATCPHVCALEELESGPDSVVADCSGGPPAWCDLHPQAGCADLIEVSRSAQLLGEQVLMCPY